MAVGYRSIFSLRRGQDPAAIATAQLRAWLALKGYGFAAITPGVHEAAGHAQLVVTELRPPAGSRSLRYRLTESAAMGGWVTTVTVHGNGEADNWIWVDVSVPPPGPRRAAPGVSPAREVDAEGAWWTGVPHMVREVLAGADACDGQMTLATQPALVSAAEVDDLISVICDPGRRGTALVAAPAPDVPLSRLVGQVERLTRECVGLAGIYVLDRGAAGQLEEAFGPSHSVPPGAIRTFLPDADPASDVDARRHRVLLPRTIAEQAPGKLAHLLGRAHRHRALDLPLPAQAVAVDRLLCREEPAAVLREMQEAPRGPASRRPDAGPAGPPLAGPAATGAVREVALSGELLTSLVGEFQSRADDGDDDVAARYRELLAEGRGVLRGQQDTSRRFAALQDRLENAEDDRDHARARLEDEQLDHAQTQAELLHAKLELDRLRGVLARAGRVEASRAALAVATSPASFAELLERLERPMLSRLVFTGNPKHALELDDFDPVGTWAARAWDMLRVLNGYAASRHRGDFSKGVHAYLVHTPPGQPGYAPGAHTTQESDFVENSPKLRKLRILPVPEAVSPDGAIFMGAHFKIARKGLVSPRMYYYDDAGQTEKIYVGYLGKHLPTAHTN